MGGKSKYWVRQFLWKPLLDPALEQIEAGFSRLELAEGAREIQSKHPWAE
jgi:hypothetical protein